MRNLLFLQLLIIYPSYQLLAQAVKCVFKKPVITIHFGSGNVRDLNTESLWNYERVSSSCPTDGHYTYASGSSDCFRGDWLTLTEDHTPGDAGGNMMIVNASPGSGTFLKTSLNGLKSNTTYEFCVWMMNVCRISDKCPFPLLPNITIRLQTAAGITVATFNTGDLVRRAVPHWTPYRAQFTTPSSATSLSLTMIDNAPGGCGNDFALDDITIRECERVPPVLTTSTKTPTELKPPAKSPPVLKPQPKTTVAIKQQPKTTTPQIKKETPQKTDLSTTRIEKPRSDSPSVAVPFLKPKTVVFPDPPPVLKTRSNVVIKQIETENNVITVDLYDNGEIDGDTVSIYHNNRLIVSNAKLSVKPISFRIAVDTEHPHHELIMVAENLGSIPPNTSLMIVNAGSKRYEVFISSTEQKNAKVIIDLKR